MSIKKNEIARCGACRFYTPVGRRGGECSQFGVPVQSAWTSCCLAESPFQKATKISNSDMNLAKITVEKEVVAESLAVPTGRFTSPEKRLAANLHQ
ncbi:MAG: hypothetical protein AAF243_07220 [Cyanobacteria bacterium P01_A01_bin.137]